MDDPRDLRTTRLPDTPRLGIVGKLLLGGFVAVPMIAEGVEHLRERIAAVRLIPGAVRGLPDFVAQAIEDGAARLALEAQVEDLMADLDHARRVADERQDRLDRVNAPHLHPEDGGTNPDVPPVDEVVDYGLGPHYDIARRDRG